MWADYLGRAQAGKVKLMSRPGSSPCCWGQVHSWAFSGRQVLASQRCFDAIQRPSQDTTGRSSELASAGASRRVAAQLEFADAQSHRPLHGGERVRCVFSPALGCSNSVGPRTLHVRSGQTRASITSWPKSHSDHRLLSLAELGGSSSRLPSAHAADTERPRSDCDVRLSAVPCVESSSRGDRSPSPSPA